MPLNNAEYNMLQEIKRNTIRSRDYSADTLRLLDQLLASCQPSAQSPGHPSPSQHQNFQNADTITGPQRSPQTTASTSPTSRNYNMQQNPGTSFRSVPHPLPTPTANSSPLTFESISSSYGTYDTLSSLDGVRFGSAGGSRQPQPNFLRSQPTTEHAERTFGSQLSSNASRLGSSCLLCPYCGNTLHVNINTRCEEGISNCSDPNSSLGTGDVRLTLQLQVLSIEEMAAFLGNRLR